MSNTKEKDYIYKECDVCGCEFYSTSHVAKYCSDICRPTGLELHYRAQNNNPEQYIKQLLRFKGRESLSVEMLLEMLEEQGGKCALSGVEMTFTKIPNTPRVHTNLSIDRIDSSKEYTLDNTQLVCAITNIMKNSLTTEELKWWCTNIVAQEGYCHS